MVRLSLSIKAELENVTNLEPSENFEFFFEVKCTSCNEVHPKYVSLNRFDEYEVGGGKHNTAHFVWRCGLCKRESSAKFDSSLITPYNNENAQFAPLLIIDCRGLEFMNFDPKGIWKCVGTGKAGTKFTDVDLAEKEWFDYDEKAAVSVSVTGFESRWNRV